VEVSLREVLESYNHIDLTEDEQMEALVWRKRKKEADIKAAEMKAREAENRKQLTESQWSYEQTEAYMKYRANQIFEGKFELDVHNQAIFDLLCYSCSNDERFVGMAAGMGIPNPSLTKGIFLAGNFGVGKTWMMKLFVKNQRQVYHVYNAKYLADAYEKEGEGAIEPFLVKTKNAYNDAACFFQPYAGLCIDDIGTEDRKTNYGNKKNVIADIIERRYEKGHIGIWLHGTTNLTADQINSFYGGRVSSRLREVVNLIEVSGEDRRK
jgi:DNA replication protein DnaC